MKPKIGWLLMILFTVVNFKVYSQTCTIVCPQNILVMADSTKEGAVVNFPKAVTTGECGTVTYTPAAGTFFRIGAHTVTATTTSGQKCSFTVTVTDNESPKLSPVKLSVSKLWPANNRMKKVALYYTTSDNAAEVQTSVAVTSNDPSSTDYQVLNNHLLRLRASRLPDGSPRIYSITVTSADVAGNLTKRTTSIAVSNTMVAIPLAEKKNPPIEIGGNN
jgi:hypothetical protein